MDDPPFSAFPYSRMLRGCTGQICHRIITMSSPYLSLQKDTLYP